MVRQQGNRAEKSSTETVYYLSIQRLPADIYMTLICGRRSIEHRLHWVKVLLRSLGKTAA